MTAIASSTTSSAATTAPFNRAATGTPPIGSPVARLPSPFPSRAALRLEETPMKDLEQVFLRGVQPDIESLLGWEFRGINRLPLNWLPWGQAVGIKKFVKGFHRAEDGRAMGYNSPVVSTNALDGRWHVANKRFGFYETLPVDATARDNEYLHAVLLDYGKGGNPALDITRGLRDYLVQVDANNPDLFLGKAYYAVGPARLGGLNFFILERFRKN